MKKELLSILSSKSNDCTTKSKFTDKFEENSNVCYEAFYAHEIRNSLNIISGMTALLTKTELTEYQRDLIDRIASSSSVVTDLLNSFLEYSSTEGCEVEKTEFSMKAFLKTLSDTYSFLAEKKGLKYIQKLSIPDNLYVYSSRFQLFHILNNLLGNALKYTEKGHISLDVYTVSETSDTVIITFSVKDSGASISADILKEVFKKDKKASENHKADGHGLGFYICKALAEQLGGTLSADSDSSGSCFSFTLTFEKACPPASLIDMENHRVLIIDDDYLNYEMISDCLIGCNAVCDYARTGEEAIAHCQSLPCDYYSIIFTDVCMPGIGGLQTAEVLKSRFHISSPVVAISGSVCSSPYIDACILKPLNRAEIIDIAGRAVAGSLVISKAKAMARLDNRQDLYDKYYNRFIENYTGAVDELRRLLSENNYDDAYRIAHSIKGLSGTLGLTDVYNNSSRLSASLHNKEAASELYINDLEISLNKLLP